jgi:hypothetical protein
MSVKEITGLMTILPDKENPKSSNKEDLQAGNIAFRSRTLARTLYFWDNNNNGSNYGINLYPWKQGNLLDDNDITVGHALWYNANLAVYPANGVAGQAQLSTLDYSKFRATGSIGTIGSGLLARVHAGIAAYDNLAAGAWGSDSIVSASDLPADYTQIGIVYAHPMTIAAATLTTAVGTNFVTFANAGWWDQSYITPTRFGVVRIATGADAGFYFVQNADFANNRLYLRNLNGTPFVGQAAATIAAADLYIGPGRTTYFNEVSIIPFSTGTVVTGGRYNPGFYPGTTQPLRCSFLCRVKIEKTGSTEVAAAAEQQGSYTIGMRPWTHGDYDQGISYEWAMYRQTVNEGNGANFPGHTFPYTSAGNGGANAMLLDEANQRCWVAHTNGNNDSVILHWRWRTIESPREVANYLGTAGHASFVTPTPVLATGDMIRGGALGSNQWVYFAVQHPTLGNGGVIIIKPDLTSLQYTENQGGASWTGTGDTIGGTAPSMTLTDAGAVFNARMVGQSVTISGAATGANNGTFVITGYTSPTVITYQNHAGVAEAFTGTWTRLGVPDSNVAAVVADKTRARIGTAGDVSTNGSNQLTSASGAFTASDIGRVIKLTGLTGDDNGVYLIATQGGTTATVTTLAGAAVTFTSQSGGTFEIGDRLYMFYNNGTTGLNKINYFESLAPGTFLTRTFSSTAGLGANCNVQANHGENQRAAIDPATGDIYWLSNDTTQQINKYNVATNAHTAILITNTAILTVPGSVLVGGTAATSANPQTPTNFNAILVNSKFDDIWVGSDAGVYRIVKSTFATATIRRYWGTEATSYVSGPSALTTGTGDGTTGLSYSAPNMTLNATGTPFVASDVGKFLVLTGSSTAANNGVFPITAFNSSSQIVCNNNTGAAMATQANYAGTFYIVSSWAQRSSGTYSSSANTNITRNFHEHPDGRTQVTLWPSGTTNHDTAYYSREADTFTFRTEIGVSGSGGASPGRNKVFDSVGHFCDFCYSAWNQGSRMYLGSIEVNYQWTGSAWTPREQAYAGTPNKSFADTTNPLCAAKPIHSTLDDLLYGVKIQFNRQGGATPANNEFLGRMGQTRITATDGATVAASNVFNGSGFVAGDTGRIIRVETGSDAGIYKATFVNAGQLTLKTMSGATFSALATVGTLTYTVWDYGSPGSNAGPEDVTFTMADGVAKDNTQDITGFTYEAYHFKTRLHENDEPRKFCVENPLAVPGTLATKVYFENHIRQTAQYDAALVHHRALPGAELANGRQIMDGITGKYMDNLVGHGNAYSNQGMDTGWRGTLADTTCGYSLMVDFGADVQIGSAILRGHCYTSEARVLNANTASGMRAAIYKANDAGGTPLGSLTKSGVGNGTAGLAFSSPTMTLNSSTAQFVAGDVGKYIVITGAATAANNGSFLITVFNSATSVSWTNASGAAQAGYVGTWYVTPTANVRTTGTANFNCTLNVFNTSALTSGDFLGPITLTPTTPAVGLITSGLTTLTDTTNAQFLASHLGQVLKITAGAGADIGSYRVISVNSSSVITIRNLDQTAKTWTVSGATVTYEIRDAVREEDQIVIGNGGHRLCVERLLTPTTLQLRTPPNATVTNQSWLCVKPTWDLVKKISYSSEATPPDVKGNLTWMSAAGRENYDFSDFKAYTDFSDLTSADRTGRYWKFTAMPRFDTDASRADHGISTWEFYDTAGNRLATSKYTMVDESRPDVNADFLFTHVNRGDFIQAANDALTGVAGFNGNANLGGGNGDTLTLTTGGNKFLGFQVGPTLTDGNPINGGNTFNSAGSAFPQLATPGRFLRIQNGTNAGYYRILTRPSATQLTVGPPSGTGSTVFSPTETGRTFSIHEGINVGGVSPDKFVFLSDNKEFTLATINDSLTTLTFVESLQPSRTNQAWEIRRPAYDTASATTEGTKTARLVRPGNTPPGGGVYPIQSGDLCHDKMGPFRFFSEDIGAGFQRADGVIAGGNGDITGSGFSPDDVGRLLYIVSGTGTQLNNGIYEIQTYTSPTSVTVKNHYTGAAVSFTADAGPVTYQIYGDRRFRLTRFVIGLRA